MHAAQPYADGITDVVRDLQAGGRGREQSAARRRASEVRRVARRRDRRRPRAVRRVQLAASSAPPRATIRAQQAAGPRDRARHGRPQGRGLLPLPQLPDRRRVHRLQRQPHVRGRARRSRRRSIGAFQSRRARPRAARLHPLHLRRPPGGRDRAAAAAPSSTRTTSTARADDRRGEPTAAYEFEPDPDAILDDAAAALRRGAHLRRAAERGGVGARGPPARDEGRDRQRRRADHGAQPRA